MPLSISEPTVAPGAVTASATGRRISQNAEKAPSRRSLALRTSMSAARRAIRRIITSVEPPALPSTASSASCRVGDPAAPDVFAPFFFEKRSATFERWRRR